MDGTRSPSDRLDGLLRAPPQPLQLGTQSAGAEMKRVVFRWAGRLKRSPDESARESRARFVGGAAAVLAGASAGILVIGAATIGDVYGCEPQEGGISLSTLPIMIFLLVLGFAMLAFAKAAVRQGIGQANPANYSARHSAEVLEQASRYLVQRCATYGAIIVLTISILAFAWRVENDPACWIPLATAMAGTTLVLGLLVWFRLQDGRWFSTRNPL